MCGNNTAQTMLMKKKKEEDFSAIVKSEYTQFWEIFDNCFEIFLRWPFKRLGTFSHLVTTRTNDIFYFFFTSVFFPWKRGEIRPCLGRLFLFQPLAHAGLCANKKERFQLKKRQRFQKGPVA